MVGLPSEIIVALLFSDGNVRTQFKRYKEGGIVALEGMNYFGSEALPAAAQLAEQDAHLQQQLDPTAASAADAVRPRSWFPPSTSPRA